MSSGIKITSVEMRYIALFENITGATVKDCIVDEEANQIIYVVKEGNVGIAIGKGGKNIRLLERMTGKKHDIIEHSENPDRAGGNGDDRGQYHIPLQPADGSFPFDCRRSAIVLPFPGSLFRARHPGWRFERLNDFFAVHGGASVCSRLAEAPFFMERFQSLHQPDVISVFGFQQTCHQVI